MIPLYKLIIEMNELVRLNKFISDNISCTRKEAETYIEEGQVRVNGQNPTLGMKSIPLLIL